MIGLPMQGTLTGYEVGDMEVGLGESRYVVFNGRG